jgi:hypothetical protein
MQEQITLKHYTILEYSSYATYRQTSTYEHSSYEQFELTNISHTNELCIPIQLTNAVLPLMNIRTSEITVISYWKNQFNLWTFSL